MGRSSSLYMDWLRSWLAGLGFSCVFCNCVLNKLFSSVVVLETGLETAFLRSFWSVCLGLGWNRYLWSRPVETTGSCRELFLGFFSHQVCEIPQLKCNQYIFYFGSVDAATWVPPMCQKEAKRRGNEGAICSSNVVINHSSFYFCKE